MASETFDTLYSTYSSDKIYVVSGQFETTLKSSVYVGSITGFPMGVSIDELGNATWAGYVDKGYLTSGTTSTTIKSSLNPAGMTSPGSTSYDGTNTTWSGYSELKLVLTSGKVASSTLKTSLDPSYISTMHGSTCCDGIDTITRTVGKVFHSSGQFTSTLKDSMALINGYAIGWDGINTLASDIVPRLYLYSGRFSSTIKASSTRTGGSSMGVGHMSFNDMMALSGGTDIGWFFALPTSTLFTRQGAC